MPELDRLDKCEEIHSGMHDSYPDTSIRFHDPIPRLSRLEEIVLAQFLLYRLMDFVVKPS